MYSEGMVVVLLMAATAIGYWRGWRNCQQSWKPYPEVSSKDQRAVQLAVFSHRCFCRNKKHPGHAFCHYCHALLSKKLRANLWILPKRRYVLGYLKAETWLLNQAEVTLVTKTEADQAVQMLEQQPAWVEGCAL